MVVGLVALALRFLGTAGAVTSGVAGVALLTPMGMVRGDEGLLAAS